MNSTTPDTDTPTSANVRALHFVTQPTRATILQKILGHPSMMPSVKELDHAIPNKAMGTITGHIEKLVEAGVARRLTIPQSYRENGMPSTFYTLSDAGYDLLKRHSLILPHREEIQEEYDAMETPEQIRDAEHAPRPTADVAYDHPLKGDGITIVDPVDGTEYTREESKPTLNL